MEQHRPVTARKLLDLAAEYVRLQPEESPDSPAHQDVAQRFDVALSEYIVERSRIQNEA